MNKKVRVNSEISNIRIIENVIDNITGEIGISKEDYGKILVSTLEAVNNAMIHGNGSDPNKYVVLNISYEKEELKIRVKDEGHGFIPHEVPDPTSGENVESLNGRGVFLMSKLADKIRYNKKGNSVTMTFKNLKI